MDSSVPGHEHAQCCVFLGSRARRTEPSLLGQEPLSSALEFAGLRNCLLCVSWLETVLSVPGPLYVALKQGHGQAPFQLSS